MVETVSILKALGNPNKARIVAHLARDGWEAAEDISGHLGYPLPTVYKYLRELESARVVESEVRGGVRVYHACDFRVEVSPSRLMEAFEGRNMGEVFRARFGDEGSERFKAISEKVRLGEMTFRQAASTLGITYYEFVSLLEETDSN